MNGNCIFLDTNIVLYLLNGNSDLVTILNKMQLFVSVITEIELLGYREISKNDKIKIKNFLSDCTIISIQEEIKDICIEIKQKEKIKTPDAIIAASAIALEIPLITSDKGFEKIEKLDLFLYKI